MAQLTGTETSAALEPRYRAFHAIRQPLPNTVVWVSTVNGDDWALRFEALSVLVGVADDQLDAASPPNTLAVTLGLARC